MIDSPEITETDVQLTAVLRLTVPRAEIQNVMGPGLGELMDAVAAQGIARAGPWFTHHLKMPSDIFDFEIGVPVAEPVSGAGRVQPGRMPAMRVARTVYHGAYEGLGAAWGEFDAWIATRGLTTGADLWERYLVGPQSDPDPAAWRTELNRPLAGGNPVVT